MSRRDGGKMDDRKFTVIVVPHGGELETRSYEISYPRMLFVLGSATVVLMVFVVVMAMWFPVLAQALRAGQLEKELAALEAERAEVAELARSLEHIEEQYERVRALLGADAALEDGTPPALPPIRRDTSRREASDEEVAGSGVIDTWPLATRGFITRPLTESGPNHPGLDIAAPENSYILAAGPGVVGKVGADRVYGNFALIDHGEGLETLYGHASRIMVSDGDRVVSREVIGLTGSTGQSTGPHLHFEVRRNGRAVDPLLFVRQP
jgi:murein DD-endopeptidase MepM/ murein hydrolase activator NlpD